jgi:hypothetical protein
MHAHSGAIAPGNADPPGSPNPRLHVRWLLIARAGWIALALLVLVLNIVMIPRFDAVLQAPCQPGQTCFAFQLTAYDRQLLHQLGISLGFLAAYHVMLDAGTVLIYCALGALIFWRKSADRIALFCAFMLVLFGGVAYTNILQDTLAPVSFAWYTLVTAFAMLGQSSFMIFFLLFPSGRFVPRWTRWWAFLIVLYWTYVGFFTNIFYSKSAGANLLFFALLLGTVGTQVYRFLRVSTPRERQQTKWVVFGFTTGMVSFVLFIIIGNTLIPPQLLQSSVLSTLFANSVLYGFLLLIPISIAVAILRSRLYDIDIIINRTLVYGALSAILGTLYAGLIIGLGSLAGLITGPGSQQPVALVISTLAIAALFQPAQRRIQAIIDRRFYRRKYDAEKTLAAFSATLRNEVELNQLREHLLAVVNETMQPAHISLWLRSPQRHTTELPHHTDSISGPLC